MSQPKEVGLPELVQELGSAKPKCFGKLPRPELRGISCGECKRFDGCCLETMQKDLAKKGVAMEKVEAKP